MERLEKNPDKKSPQSPRSSVMAVPQTPCYAGLIEIPKKTWKIRKGPRNGLGVFVQPLEQRCLDVLNTTLDDVLELPARWLVSGGLALCEFFAVFHLLDVHQTIGNWVSATSNTAAELELQNVAGLVASCKKTVQIILGVSGRDTESGARRDERCGRVSNDDDSDLALEHFVGEGGNLGGVVQEQRNNRLIVVTIDDETETLESETKVS